MSFEVREPILNSPFAPPTRYWFIQPGEDPVCRDGRRPAIVFQPRGTTVGWDTSDGMLERLPEYENGYGLPLVNRLRERVGQWRAAGYPGVSRTTLDLISWWRRDGRDRRLFFAQLEAAETVIFLTEARADLRQGVEVPREEPTAAQRAEGASGFIRYACKMATGSGKTTVMGMLVAWSILNKVSDKTDRRFSDAVLVVCPNVTIRDRLRELDPKEGDASLYRTRDLVPPHLMPLLTRGTVVVTNWHVFEPQETTVGDTSARVNKSGVRQARFETIHIGEKTTTARGKRYLTLEEYERQVNAGMLQVVGDETYHPDGRLKSVKVGSERYVESDEAVLARVLGRDIGKKQNILVFNDEAHHAYRIYRDEVDDENAEAHEEDEEEYVREATVWIEGLDRVHRLRAINVCVDLSATPYYLARVGRDTGRPFPWIVSDFGLTDAIESGLVKIPQLPSQDTTGGEHAAYFNLWEWIKSRLSSAERGGRRGSIKSEAVLKHAHVPIAILAGEWKKEWDRWREVRQDQRPPVFILVCKDIALSKVVYDWIAEGKAPTGMPTSSFDWFRNRPGETNTIRVDTKVVHETDTESGGGSKGDEARWMRFTLDTVGKLDWPCDRQGRPIYPAGFEELARKLERPLHPPGRDVRCIVSVGMLTEGWDCNTVTHIVGLRPFMSQLLCEQVVGRGLRRASYEPNEEGKFGEEIAQVFGVPFEVIPFKATNGSVVVTPKRYHVHALPSRAELEIRFPRVVGYTQTVRNRVTVDWESVAPITLAPGLVPPETRMVGLAIDTRGAPSLTGPGRVSEVSLASYRAGRRLQEIVFDLARDLTRNFVSQAPGSAPSHVLFPQMRAIVARYVEEKVEVLPPNDIKDVGCMPYYPLVLERLLAAIRPDTAAGESPEVPVLETLAPEGSTAGVDYWTSKLVWEPQRSQVNYVVKDSGWETQAAYYIDGHPAVEAFVKNAGLGFTIPYVHDGQPHDFVPDFIIRLRPNGNGSRPEHLILETKGHDPLADVKGAAAERWVGAVNADGRYGKWRFEMARKVADVSGLLPSRYSHA